MAAVSLTTLRARARERADMVGSVFIVDSADSLDAWINEGAKKLHDLLTQAYGDDYLEKSSTFVTASGTTDYNLPSDFYKLLGVSISIGSRSITLKPYNRSERDAYSSATVSWRAFPRYKLSKGVIRLAPDPGGNYTCTLWYQPLLQVAIHGNTANIANELVNADDTIDFPNGWERYVLMYAARQALKKQDRDFSALELEITKEENDLKAIMENRNADAPMSATDVDVIDLDPRWY